MSWIILIVSGILEAVWASALAETKGFKRLVPTIIFVVALVLSMGGLAYAMTEIPVGTSYAVWVGIGAVLTAAWAIFTKKERATLIRIGLLLALVACIVGLKVVS